MRRRIANVGRVRVRETEQATVTSSGNGLTRSTTSTGISPAEWDKMGLEIMTNINKYYQQDEKIEKKRCKKSRPLGK